jgi:hypothetical protein
MDVIGRIASEPVFFQEGYSWPPAFSCPAEVTPGLFVDLYGTH